MTSCHACPGGCDDGGGGGGGGGSGGGGEGGGGETKRGHVKKIAAIFGIVIGSVFTVSIVL